MHTLYIYIMWLCIRCKAIQVRLLSIFARSSRSFVCSTQRCCACTRQRVRLQDGRCIQKMHGALFLRWGEAQRRKTRKWASPTCHGHWTSQDIPASLWKGICICDSPLFRDFQLGPRVALSILCRAGPLRGPW